MTTIMEPSDGGAVDRGVGGFERPTLRRRKHSAVVEVARPGVRPPADLAPSTAGHADSGGSTSSWDEQMFWRDVAVDPSLRPSAEVSLEAQLEELSSSYQHGLIDEREFSAARHRVIAGVTVPVIPSAGRAASWALGLTLLAVAVSIGGTAVFKDSNVTGFWALSPSWLNRYLVVDAVVAPVIAAGGIAVLRRRRAASIGMLALPVSLLGCGVAVSSLPFRSGLGAGWWSGQLGAAAALLSLVIMVGVGVKARHAWRRPRILAVVAGVVASGASAAMLFVDRYRSTTGQNPPVAVGRVFHGGLGHMGAISAAVVAVLLVGVPLAAGLLSRTRAGGWPAAGAALMLLAFDGRRLVDLVVTNPRISTYLPVSVAGPARYEVLPAAALLPVAIAALVAVVASSVRTRPASTSRRRRSS
jgi:hypothetical protein